MVDNLPGIACAIQSFAQTDPHFTQNYTYPMYVNPALTGSSDGEYRVSSIYRTQWGSISNPYRTIGVSFDARTNKNIAFGVNLLNQSAGDGGFNYLSAYWFGCLYRSKIGKGSTIIVLYLLYRGCDQSSCRSIKIQMG